MENPPPSSATHRGEAERLLGIASKLLVNRDLRGSRDFAILAQETEPLLDGSDQILAVTDVLLAAEDRINYNHHDWYSILQIDRKSDDLEMAKRQYRRLALLLHPDKNKFPFADVAFNLVRDAWAVLSDGSKKSVYDNEMNFFFTKVDLVANEAARNPNIPPVVRNPPNNNSMHQHQEKMTPVRRGGANSKLNLSFWTACPYCYVLYEYPNAYNECCLRCQKCERAFHAAAIESELPPLVHGKEAYYCCWSYFPLGFTSKTNSSSNNTINGGFPNWMPPVFSNTQQQLQQDKEEDNVVNHNNVEDFSDVNGNNGSGGGFDMGSGGAAKKRGRPRKYPPRL